MQRRTYSYAAIAVLCLIVALGLAAWLVSSVNELHDRFARESRSLGLAFLVVLIVLLAIGATWLARQVLRPRVDGSHGPAVPADMIQAAALAAQQAEGVIRQLRDESVKGELDRELGKIKAGQHHREFHVVVFGTGSAGKTSLVSALLGRNVGETEAVMGTTRHGENHTYTMEDINGTVFLTDTPGLSEAGAGGAVREHEARELASRADLLLFVLDHDLIRTEHEPLAALVRQGKRSIVLLNKADRFTVEDRNAILARLRERLRGVVPPEDVVASAAAPRPVAVRVQRADGSSETILEQEQPDLGALRARIASILKKEGDALRAGNLLLRAHILGRKAQDQLSKERDQKAQDVIERFQWITAATVFTNPFPALEFLASGAVQFQMISELANVYGFVVSTSSVRMIGTEMIQMLLKLGLVEATTSLIAGIFKSSVVGYAAGGAVQAVSMAYLTHVAGETFAEYFRRGQTWGDGGLQAALTRQFDLTSRADFLQEFAKQALQKVSTRILPGASRAEGQQAAKN
jgi:small GTP-binding protein